MKSMLIALAIVLVAATSVPSDAFARRIGGGGTSGMQRSLPPRVAPTPAPPAEPAVQPAAAPTTAGVPAAAAVPKRSWLGPLAGIAAGLGIAALMSHLGLGAELGNIVMLFLLLLVGFVAVRFLMRRFGPGAGGAQAMQYAGAGTPLPATVLPQGLGASTGTPAALVSPLPAGFDAAGFERIAKMIFIRLQAANDSGDLNDLRAFTTPEMFAAVRLDLQDRGAKAQQTDVVRVDAEVLDVTSEPDRQIVSVRFHGLIREEVGAGAEPFDEVWHLVKPADGSREWAIAGIQQSGAPLAQAA
jgi:predicted lipid-binding transport protein (Tim44 family)